MRPLDVVVLLKIIALGQQEWQYRDLSAFLSISISEISESLNRNNIAGLIAEDRKSVHRAAFMEFLQYGLPYVFPVLPGQLITGMATAHSHPFYKKHFSSDLDYVWKDDNGDLRGVSVVPLHNGVPKAAKNDEVLYKLLAGIDILRVGKVREKKLAIEELKKVIMQ